MLFHVIGITIQCWTVDGRVLGIALFAVCCRFFFMAWLGVEEPRRDWGRVSMKYSIQPTAPAREGPNPRRIGWRFHKNKYNTCHVECKTKEIQLGTGMVYTLFLPSLLPIAWCILGIWVAKPTPNHMNIFGLGPTPLPRSFHTIETVNRGLTKSAPLRADFSQWTAGTPVWKGGPTWKGILIWERDMENIQNFKIM